MPEFIVKAWETMETTYLVTARGEAHAREKVEALGIDHDLDQLDASVFEVEIRSVEKQPQRPSRASGRKRA